MADTYLEYDYLSKKKQRRRALRKRPRWPFVLLGFFIGFVTLPVLIALTVFLVVSRPVEKTVNSIDKIANVGLYETLFGTDDEVGYLDDRYGEMSLTEALNDIIKIAEKGSQLTFEDLSSISPQVEQSIDKLIESAEKKSIILDKVEVMTTPLNQFSDLLMDEVKEIELGEVLLATKADIFEDGQTGAILKNLFFGKAGVNYTEIDGKITMLPITYVYDGENSTFTCVDETLYSQDGTVWRAENSDDYIAVYGEGFALYSSYGDVIYQLQAKESKSLTTTFTAVTVNAEGMIQTVKQSSLALGAFMEEGSDPMKIIGKLELGTLLGITTKEQAENNGNKMLVSLAYGTYGTDFEYDGESDDSLIIAKAGGKAFTTLNDLMSSPDQVLNGLQLGSLLGITTKADAEKDSNAMLVALAYGTYGVDFEYDGEEDDSLIIPKDGGKAFTSLGDLINSPDKILNDIRLGSLLGITTKADAEKDGNAMLVALAYGTYGVDFEYDGKEDDSLIVPIGTKEFTTLGDLIENPDEILYGIQLGSLLGITTHADAINDNNKTLVALAYGTYGIDYNFFCDGVECTDKECVDPDCKIVEIADSDRHFTTLDDLMNHSEDVLNEIPLGTLLGITTKADVDSGDNDMMVAIAYGTYGVNFKYDGDSADSLIIPFDDTQEFTTLGDLIHSPNDVLQTIQLGSLLGITTKDDIEGNAEKNIQAADPLLVSLAYGTYDVDFVYDENDKIVAKAGGEPFTTVAMLMDSDEVAKILEDIPLSSIFTVDILDDVEDDSLTVSLVYGTEGKHYTIETDEESGEKYVNWLTNEETGEVYGERTFGDLRDGDLTDIVNDLRVGDIFEVTESSPKLLSAIQDWFVADLGNSDKINSLKLKDVIEVGTTGVLAEMGEWSIGDISESKIKSIKLSSVLDAGDEAGLIASLANKTDENGDPWTIGHLTEDNIKTLTVGEVLPGAIGADPATDFFAALKDTKLSELNAEYIKEQLTIGQVLGITEEDGGILGTFADYKVGEFDENALKTELTIGDVVDPSAHPILEKLANTSLNDVNNQAIQNALNDLALSEVLEIDENSHALFQYMQNKKLGEIDAEFIDGISIQDALGIESTTDPILLQIMDLSLGDLKDSSVLKDRITNLQLNQLMDVSGIPVLDQLGDYKINELDEDAINSLKICDIIEGAEDNFYLKHLSTSTLGTLSEDINNITVVKLFADTMEYETDSEGNIVKDENGHPVIKGTWKYLLKWNWDSTAEDADSAPNKEEVAPENYKVSDMAAMIENMHNNIEAATLRDLKTDGMAEHLDDETLDANLVYEIGALDFSDEVLAITGGDSITDADNDGTLDDLTVGDLNVLQVSQYLSLVLKAINSIS